jgi:membrane-associated protein
MIGLPLLDVSSPVSYLVALIAPALDALLPVVPSETAVIALGVATAGHSDPRIVVLVVLAACGAFLGDNLAYLLGRRFAPVVERRFFSGERGKRRRAWAEHALDRFGARIIIACRFIPGGRTAVTLTCGVVGYRRRSFVAATACAGLIWAAYAFLIGRLGGRTFEDRPWAGLLLALGAALVISALAEVLRQTRPWRLLRRARSRPPGGAYEPVAARSKPVAASEPVAARTEPVAASEPVASQSAGARRCPPGQSRPGTAKSPIS